MKRRMQTVLLALIGITILAVLAMFVISAVASRPDSIGIQNHQLAPLPQSPNCVSSLAADESHRIPPLTYSGLPAEAMQSLLKIVQSMPNATVVTEADEYLYVEFRSRIFRYVDDVEFLVAPDESVIHCRSAARVGYSDMGVNRLRIEEIRSRFE